MVWRMPALLVVVVALVSQACRPEQRSPDVATAPPATSASPASATTSAADSASNLVVPVPRPTVAMEFKAALDLGQTAGAEPQLRHGRIANSTDWPASLYATFQTPSGTAACTAALVGPQAMLTAGHCVPAVGGVIFSYHGQAKPYVASCTQHPHYLSHQDASADYALCKLDRPFVQPTGFMYETISTTGFDSFVGTTIVLTGYGCIGDAVANLQFDDKYRIGTNTIEETSATLSGKRGPAFYTPKENNNLFTKDDPNLANLCPGDSGGPAFRRTGGTADQFTSRVIVGVNSRVFYTSPAMTAFGSSLVSATAGPDFRVWAEEWAKTVAKVPVCGVDGAIPNCRS